MGANSIVRGWSGVVCQVGRREIVNGDKGFVGLEGAWGVDMRIMGCFCGSRDEDFLGGKGMPQGLKPRSYCRRGRPKAEALDYLEDRVVVER